MKKKKGPDLPDDLPPRGLSRRKSQKGPRVATVCSGVVRKNQKKRGGKRNIATPAVIPNRAKVKRKKSFCCRK